MLCRACHESFGVAGGVCGHRQLVHRRWTYSADMPEQAIRRYCHPAGQGQSSDLSVSLFGATVSLEGIRQALDAIPALDGAVESFQAFNAQNENNDSLLVVAVELASDRDKATFDHLDIQSRFAAELGRIDRVSAAVYATAPGELPWAANPTSCRRQGARIGHPGDGDCPPMSGAARQHSVGPAVSPHHDPRRAPADEASAGPGNRYGQPDDLHTSCSRGAWPANSLPVVNRRCRTHLGLARTLCGPTSGSSTACRSRSSAAHRWPACCARRPPTCGSRQAAAPGGTSVGALAFVAEAPRDWLLGDPYAAAC